MEEKKKRYWGIGSTHDKKPVVNDFINKGIACVGWDEKQAGTLHEILKHHIKKDDIIFIKSYSPSNGLYIKAVGIVNDVEYRDRGNGKVVGVKWHWTGKQKLGIVRDKYNVRSITLFEEFNPDIIQFLNSKL